MNANIVLLPGDGIGPEIIEQSVRVLDAVAKKFGHTFHFEKHLIGGCAIDAHGVPLPDATVNACLKCDAILLGAVGGPKWDDPKAKVRPEQGLLGIRKALGLFANLRPVKVLKELADGSPLRPERIAGVDILFIRELTGGVYFGPRGTEQTPKGTRSFDTMEYTDYEIRRVVKLAFEVARGRRKFVASVDKANVLESSRLWRSIANEVAKDYPDVKLEHHLVDSTAMKIITGASYFDVVVTENMFGDILTDEAAVLGGSLGLLPSASLGEGTRGLYEPIHGSAPDIAGKGIANPIGTILSAAMLLRHSLKLTTEAAAIEAAVEKAIAEGLRSRDLGGQAGTIEVADAILARLA